MASINKIGTPYYSIFVVKFLKNIHMKLSELHIGFIHSVNERFREHNQITAITFCMGEFFYCIFSVRNYYTTYIFAPINNALGQISIIKFKQISSKG